MIFNLIKRAKDLFFKNTGTGLQANNVQDAIEELNTTKQPLLSNPLVQADVVNHLGSTATNKPLSANMGKVLNEGKLGFEDVLNTYPMSISSLGDATRPISQQAATTTYRAVNNIIDDLLAVRNTVDGHTTSINSLNTNVNNLKAINNADSTLVTNCNNAPFGISATTDSASNRPFTTSGFATLITMKIANNNNYRHQICLYADGPSFWVRRMWSGSWGAWTRIQ